MDPDKESSSKQRNWFSRRIYAATFGRYETSGPVEFPYNESLIGRSRERAKFLTTLFSSGGKGSYLVTGHRGSGKSTFVDYCLEQYRRSVFERYLRANVGRAFLWDRVGLIGVAIILTMLMLLVHETLLNFVRPAVDRSVFVWFLGGVLALIALIPTVSAAERFALIIDRIFDRLRYAKKSRPKPIDQLSFPRPTPLPMLAVCVVLAAIWFVLPWSDPNVAIAHIGLATASAAFSAGLLGLLRVKRWNNLTAAFMMAAGIGLIEKTLGPYLDATSYWILSSMLVGAYLLMAAAQSLLVFLAFNRKPTSGQAHASRSTEYRVRQSLQTIQSSALWHGVVGLLLVVLPLGFLRLQPSGDDASVLTLTQAFAALSVLFLLTAGCGFCAALRYKSATQKEREEYALHSDRSLINSAQGDWQLQNLLVLIKAGFLILLSVQMLYPLAQHLLPRTSNMPSIVGASVDALTDLAWEGSLFELATSPDGRTRDLLHDGSSTAAGSSSSEKANLTKTYWCASLILLLSLLAYLEYEWIVRPAQHSRQDRPLFEGPGSKLGSQFENSEPEAISAYRIYQQRLFSQTFFSSIYSTWLPVIIVPVNLGFDKLDHRRVVEAMLTGLRTRYEKAFLSSGTYHYFLFRGMLALAVVALASSAAYFWFALDSNQRQRLEKGEFCSHYVPLSLDSEAGVDVKGSGVSHIELHADTTQQAPPREEPATPSPQAMTLVCHLGGETLAKALQWPVFGDARAEHRRGPQTGQETEVAHDTGSVYKLLFPEIQRTDYFVARGYHVLMGIGAYWILFVFLSGSRMFPYRHSLRKIDELLQSLSSSLREEPRGDAPLISRVVGVFTGSEKVRHWESGPFDPRTVEISVLTVLEEIQSPVFQIPFIAKHRLNLPVPEVIFRFDELDKLGLGVIPEHETTGADLGGTDEVSRERKRTQALHSLFADLKNLLSSGAARFIFIGGRNLHDEWLADQTARHPLLSNIFESELYLPSLLTGGLDHKSPELGIQVKEFFYQTYWRAFQLNERSLLRRYRPWLTLWSEEREEPIFADEQAITQKLDSSDDRGRIPQMTRVGRGKPETPGWREAFEAEFIQFLAYRSLGNLKRLKSLLESYIQPADRVLKVDDSWDQHFDCRHVLEFRDEDRFRIQVIAEVYRRVTYAFNPRMLYRDDKLVVGTFYISDFLLKFHRRAFAWSGLQRVDELVNIHRAPDLPRALSHLLDAWSEHYLHTIRNGMYDYRFNSEFAHELQYLSRRSEQELAALNFTLDESQALKAVYRSRYENLQQPEAYEFAIALAELHEFDEEYEMARYYYQRASRFLDDLIDRQVGRVGKKKRTSSAFFELLSETNDGLELARRRFAWGIARLRLKLLIGMSYEKSKDFEQAQAHYRNARTVASSLRRALLNVYAKKGKEKFMPLVPDIGKPDYVSTLGHMNLLFQPVFAEAWIAEKFGGGVDEGVGMLERSIWELRWSLPFVNQTYCRRSFLAYDPEELKLHQNFALVMAEQHNKVGDLFFVKGRPAVSSDFRNKEGKKSASSKLPRSGFLAKARYHYAIALHEVKSFNANRWRASSTRSKNRERTDDVTMDRGVFVDYVLHTAAGSLADLSEVAIARWSFFGLLLEAKSANVGRPGANSQGLKDAIGLVKHWLDDSDQPADKLAWQKAIKKILGMSQCKSEWLSLSGWLGKADRKLQPVTREDLEDPTRPENQSVQELIQFGKRCKSNLDLFGTYLAFGSAAADLLEEAGHFEEAARSHLRLLSALNQVLRCALLAEHCGLPTAGSELISDKTRQLLSGWADMALELSEKAELLFRRSRHTYEEPPNGHKIGWMFPNMLASQTLGLGLLSRQLECSGNSTLPIKTVVERCKKWLPPEKPQGTPSDDRKWIRRTLRALCDQHPYPMLARLETLRLLAEDLGFELLRTPMDHYLPEKPDELVERLEVLLQYVGELEELSEVFESGIHFPPVHLGFVHALVFRVLGRVDFERLQKNIETHTFDKKDPDANQRLRDEYEIRQDAICRSRKNHCQRGRAYLLESQEMYSMHRAYYRTIGDMYYLYDDFNDRMTHYNHAIQMACSDLTVEFLKQLSDENCPEP